MRLILLAAVSVLTLSVNATAQTVVQGKNKTVYKDRTYVTFGDTELDGTPVKPDGQYVLAHPKFKFDSLIKLRVAFTPELQKSVERL